MDRTGKIGVAVCIIILVVWQIYYSKEMQKVAEAQRVAAAEKAAHAAEVAPATPGQTPALEAGNPPAGTAGTAAPAAQQQIPEKIENLATSAIDYQFTNRGGGIAKAVLLKHVAESGKVTSDDTKVTLNQIGTTPIGAVTERPGEEALAPFTATSNPGGREITFERVDSRQIQTVKKFTLPNPDARESEQYTVGLEVAFTNQGTQPVQMPAYYVSAGAAAGIHKTDQAIYTGISYFHDNSSTFKALTTFTSGGVLGFGRSEQPIFSQGFNSVGWLGVTNQYFTTIVTPGENANGSTVWAHKFRVDNVTVPGAPDVKTTVDAVEGALGMPGFSIAPGQTLTQRFSIYTGPREHRLLKELGRQQERVMDFGMFAPISRTLLWAMNHLKAILGSYAAAIVVLTLIIKCGLWPLQNKATNSMKRMQALQPKMTELREKYQDDPQRMNAELMKLYKEYGVNPVGGCFPMLIQIPIFFGFYNMLGKAVELRNSHFLWVHDLSQPDTIGHIAGFPINVLPLIMAGTMLWQMSLSPKSGDPVQQRMFMFMPLIFVFFCYNFASALALYWTVQNLFSVAQLYVTRNQSTPALQKIALPGKKKRA